MARVPNWRAEIFPCYAEFTIVPNFVYFSFLLPDQSLYIAKNKCSAPYTLSGKLSDFTEWRHTWRKNWVNCVVSIEKSAGLRTVFPVVFQTQNCAVQSGNPTVSSVCQPKPWCRHLKRTHRTGKKLTNLIGNLCCAREHAVQFFVQFFTQFNLSALYTLS
jgi:hypothetical protein